MPNEDRQSPYKHEEKRWRVVLTYAGEEIYLDDKEYESYKKAIASGVLLHEFKDGRIITTKPLLVEQNPFWIDPKKEQFFKVKKKLLDEYQELKAQGTFTRFEDYIEWKKKQLTKK